MTDKRDQTVASLLRRMAPKLDPGLYAYTVLAPDTAPPDGLTPLMTCREAEGLTLVLPLDQAQTAGLATRFPCRLITLTVHSELDAVGFIAAIAPELARHGISCNVIAGYHHDHLLVPQERAQDAMAVLQTLSDTNSIDEA
ncbi:ACT domain-containing protein [Maricaulis parjimensis]|uniref:ACT domain-containing protein n=1 Tax=Maricaulis parjimensis TaxID=144023 RepID=UPI00193AB382|nr:ACT domain-containing protein [Maricaulis parjimensis]